MKKTKINDLRNLSELELRSTKESLEKELFDLRQKKASGQLDKPHEFKRVRRQIAQINTLKREALHAKKS